jgi:transcription elongation factor Elf1
MWYHEEECVLNAALQVYALQCNELSLIIELRRHQSVRNIACSTCGMYHDCYEE